MKYVVDTNVLSEITKQRPNDAVINWFHDHNELVHITTVTIMELYYGIAKLPDGKRKARLLKTADGIVRECSDRTLDFDSFSTYLCAQLRRDADAHGRPPQLADCMIAAICQRNDAVLVTHNMKDFKDFGIEVVDPFEYVSPTLLRLREEEAQREERERRMGDS